MLRVVKALALCSLGLVAAPMLQGQQVISTLTCSTGGSVALTLPVYSLYFDTDSSFNFYFSAYTNISNYNELVYAQYFLVKYDSCQFSNGMGNVANIVTIEDVSAAAGQTPSATYALISFSFKSLALGPNSEVRAKGGAATPDEKAKALAVFQAKIPPIAKQ